MLGINTLHLFLSYDTNPLFHQTPGPGSYTIVKPVKAERSAQLTGFSMLGRTYPPGDRSKRPGPGAHSPEKVNLYTFHFVYITFLNVFINNK